MNNKDIHSYLSDKEVSTQGEDKFQRYSFSKRVAETIVKRNSNDSLVIGIYGTWGEGKTSVLNFIKNELNQYSSEIIHFTFNPWRFTDESTLLTFFFNTLATKIVESVEENDGNVSSSGRFRQIINWWKNKRGVLKTDKEGIGDIVKEYGKLASIFGAREVAESIGSVLSDIDAEELKKRIETLLADKKRRVVIFIDDIDRLEKHEIHAIFRLVKLTGSFTYTTYLLSFDDTIVSAALADKFSSNKAKPRENFLEKIIQVPLRLPMAQKSDLRKYCFELVNSAAEANEIILSDQEREEFTLKFSYGYFERLDTPRSAVRYGNSIYFALPLLKGEVNYVDLLLIEAMRVFYPDFYDFIKNNPHYFIGSYDEENNRYQNNKIEEFKRRFDNYTLGYSLEEKEAIKHALFDLFPNMKNIFTPYFSRRRFSFFQRKGDRRIFEIQYFDRYFLYAVDRGDVSDVIVDEFLNNLTITTFDTTTIELRKLLSFNLISTMDKIRVKEKQLDENASIVLIKVFSGLGDMAYLSERELFDKIYFINEVCSLANNLIRNNISEKQRKQICIWIIENAIPHRFAFEIFKYLYGQTKSLLKKEDSRLLFKLFLKRVQMNQGEIPIWEDTSLSTFDVVTCCIELLGKEELNIYVKKYLNQKSEWVITLILSPMSPVQSSRAKKMYYRNLDKSTYDWLDTQFDVDILYAKAENVLGVCGKEINDFVDLKEEQTEENILKQFIYWYNQDKTQTKV